MSRKRLSTYTAPPAEVAQTLDALRAHYEVPTAFPPEALVEAEAAAGAWAQDGPARLLADGARDARDLELVTIDPPGSMDLDQAVLLERLPAQADHAAQAGAAAGEAGAAQEPAAVYRVHYAIASLATGRLTWQDALADGALHASGERCDLSAYLPLVRLPG